MACFFGLHISIFLQKEDERKEWLKDDRDKTELIVNIGMVNSGYIVYFGDKELAILQNHDPLWAINYTYVRVVQKNLKQMFKKLLEKERKKHFWL